MTKQLSPEELQKILTREMVPCLPTSKTLVFGGEDGVKELGDVLRQVTVDTTEIRQQLFDMDSLTCLGDKTPYLDKKEKVLALIRSAITDLELVQALINYKTEHYMAMCPKEI